MISAMYAFIRARDRAFGNLIYTDPSWHIIMLLHAARNEQVAVTVADLDTAIPASRETINRCYALLEINGLVERLGNSEDAPVALTDTALALVSKSFEGLRDGAI